MRNTKLLFEKFKVERGKDKTKLMDMEDELRKMKTLMRGGDSDKDKIKQLIVEIDDQKFRESETQQQNEKLQQEITKLQTDLKLRAESTNGNSKGRETEIIRLRELGTENTYKIDTLEKDRDSYYEQFKASKEDVIKKDKELSRLKRELEIKSEELTRGQDLEVYFFLLTINKYLSQKNNSCHKK